MSRHRVLNEFFKRLKKCKNILGSQVTQRHAARGRSAEPWESADKRAGCGGRGRSSRSRRVPLVTVHTCLTTPSVDMRWPGATGPRQDGVRQRWKEPGDAAEAPWGGTDGSYPGDDTGDEHGRFGRAARQEGRAGSAERLTTHGRAGRAGFRDKRRQGREEGAGGRPLPLLLFCHCDRLAAGLGTHTESSCSWGELRQSGREGGRQISAISRPAAEVPFRFRLVGDPGPAQGLSVRVRTQELLTRESGVTLGDLGDSS